MLSGASIRVISEIAYNLSTDDMIGEFIKARVVESDEGFLAMTSKIDEAAAEYANKGKKAELGLIYLKQNRKSKLIPVASALVSRGLRKAGAKEEARLNRYLMQDGYRYDSKLRLILPSVGKPDLEKDLASELDLRLKPLDQRFVKMHRGVWDALVSGSRDAARQSVSSSRELLRQVFDQLAGKVGEKLDRRSKVKLILGSRNNAKVIDAVAALIVEIYGTGSADEHTTSDAEDAALIGKLTEYCLLYVLRAVQGRHPPRAE